MSDDPNLYLRNNCRCLKCQDGYSPAQHGSAPEGTIFFVEQVLHYPPGQHSIFEALDLPCQDAYWKPGWYFWDETQTAALGMFQNYQYAQIALMQYAQYLDDGTTPPDVVKAYWFNGQDGAPDNSNLNEWYDDAPLFVPIYETTLP